MDLPTYTNIWRIEKRLYKLYDFKLPQPLPVVTLGVFLGVCAVWFALMSLIGVPFDTPWHVVWLVPPGVITFFATRPVIEGKRLTELLLSHGRYLTEARVYTRLAPESEPAEVRVTVRVWHRDPAAPLPAVARKNAKGKGKERPGERGRAPAPRERATKRPPKKAPAAAPAPLRVPAAQAAREAAPLWGGDAEPGGREERAVRTRRTAAPAEDTGLRAPVASAIGVDAQAPEPRRASEADPEPRPAFDTAAHRAHAPQSGTEQLPDAASRFLPPDEPPEEHGEHPARIERGTPAARRGVGLRVLNYFGFALPKGEPPHAVARRDTPSSGLPAAERTELGPVRDAGNAPALDARSEASRPLPVEAAEEVSRPSPAADTAEHHGHGDAEPEPSTADSAAARRRAEEMMAAPPPAADADGSVRAADNGTDTDSAPADPMGTADADNEAPAPADTAAPARGPRRRLHARAQGVRITHRLERERAASTETADAGTHRPTPPAAPEERVQEHARAPEPPRRARGFGAPAPAAPAPAATEADHEQRPRRPRRRPHAAPWDLPIPLAGQDSDPDSGSTPDPSGDEPTTTTGEATTEHDARPAPARPAPDPASSGAPAKPGGDQKPPLQLDHGTGEHESMFHVARSFPAAGTKAADTAAAAEPTAGPAAAAAPDPASRPSPREGGEDRAGAARDERMEVLDRHLNRTDTPPPPPPRFAEADGAAPREPVAWFTDDEPEQQPTRRQERPALFAADGSERPVPDPIAADQARGGQHQGPKTQTTPHGGAERAGRGSTGSGHGPAAPTDASPDAGPAVSNKPRLELDHGTGEHESFSEVGVSRPRATAADLEAAEAAAIRARRRKAETPAPSDTAGPSRSESAAVAGAAGAAEKAPAAAPDSTTAAEEAPKDSSPAARPGRERSSRLSRTMRATPTGGQPSSAASAPAQAPERPEQRSTAAQQQEPRTETAQQGDGTVFARVAHNARRISHMFGQTPPGTAPEPPADTSAPAHPADPPAETAEAGDERDTAKPALQLDHGTGEQQRLADTPNGTPTPRAAAPAHKDTAPGPSGGTRGWRRLARVITGGTAAPAKPELPAGDVERLRTPLGGARSIVVLGCTGGAGQTITTLMLGHTLAAYRDERVVAVDINPGSGGLSRRVRTETPETLTSLLANADSVHGYLGMRGYTTQTKSGLEIVSTLNDPYVQTLDDRDYAGLAGLLETHYEVTLIDPAAPGVVRALPITDGLVLVVPASQDAARSVAMTFEWLDGHGYTDLRAKAVVVINGVSKRSLGDVDAAEQVARGRCRAIVRVPWDDHLGAGTLVDTGALRATTRRAHAALGGVLMRGLAESSAPISGGPPPQHALRGQSSRDQRGENASESRHHTPREGTR